MGKRKALLSKAEKAKIDAYNDEGYFSPATSTKICRSKTVVKIFFRIGTFMKKYNRKNFSSHNTVGEMIMIMRKASYSGT